MLLDIFF